MMWKPELAIIDVNFDLENFLNKLNDLVPSIKFTFEKENNQHIPFLDVLIIRFDNELKFKIFRKPTNNLSYVHFYSGHSEKIKYSVFSSMFLRALRIVSPQYLDMEEKEIRSIAESLCYPVAFIEKSYCKAKKTFYSNVQREPTQLTNILTLPYNNELTHLVPLFKLLNINLVFNFKVNLKSILIKNSPTNQNNIIYKIPCKDCPKFYIGQTSKPLQFRLSQHKYCIRSGLTNNALFVHLSENSHRINWDESTEIMHCNTSIKRNILESALIKISWSDNFNINEGLYNFDDIILKYMKKELKAILPK